MMKRSDVAWTLVGITAVLLSGSLLYQEIRGLSLAELTDSLGAISYRNWLMASLATLGAYCALAWYDRIAVAHLGKHIAWWFITLCAFTTGVLEVTFRAAVPELPTADVLAALIVFRVFYLLLPLALAILVVAVFEATQWSERRRKGSLGP